MGFNRITRGTMLAGGVNMDGASLKIKRLSITSTPTGSEQDTGWDLPANSIVLDVFVNVTTAEATGTTKTLDVGLLSSESGGDADGFLDGVSVASTGIVRGAATYTNGVNQNYISARTLGVLLWDGLDGTDEAGDAGTGNPTYHVVGTAKSVSYTAGSNDFAEFRGDIYIVYVVLE